MDVGEVRANSEILARAIAADNRDHISAFLTDRAKADLFLILDELPRIQDATVGDVDSVERDVATALICLQAPKAEFVLQTVWVERGIDIAVEAVRFFEWDLKMLSSSSASLDLHPFPGEAS